MSFSTTVFKAIDVLFDAPQNRRRLCTDKEGLVSVEYDVIYDPSCPDICKMDIYSPAQEDNYTGVAILEIHGGGFVAGDKKHRRGLSTWLVKNTGAKVFNANYGLGPACKFPDPVRHVAAAFNYIVSNAEKYKIDPDKILVCGDSAGGYYSAMLCAMQCSEDFSSRFDVKLQGKISGAILNCGVYDLERALSKKIAFDLTGKLVKDFLGIDIKDIRKYPNYDILSPITYVNGKFPRTFITYAEKDVFCAGQGEALIQKFEEYEIPYTQYHSVSFGENHTYPLTWSSKGAKVNNAAMADFITTNFGTKE